MTGDRAIRWTAPWGVFRPGQSPSGYGFTHAASWWTPLHLALLAAVLAWFAFALAVGVVIYLRDTEPAEPRTLAVACTEDQHERKEAA
jgi:hypothetical protein